MKYIGVFSIGVSEMMNQGLLTIADICEAFRKEARKWPRDWFYTFRVKGVMLYAEDNHEDGYTVCLPSEY